MRILKKIQQYYAKIEEQEKKEKIAKVEARRQELEKLGKLELELKLFDIRCIEIQDGVSLKPGGWLGRDYWLSYSGMISEDKFVLSRILWGGRASIFEPDKPHQGIPYYLPSSIRSFKIEGHEFEVIDVNEERLIIKYMGRGYAQFNDGVI